MLWSRTQPLVGEGRHKELPSVVHSGHEMAWRGVNLLMFWNQISQLEVYIFRSGYSSGSRKKFFKKKSSGT